MLNEDLICHRPTVVYTYVFILILFIIGFLYLYFKNGKEMFEDPSDPSQFLLLFEKFINRIENKIDSLGCKNGSGNGNDFTKPPEVPQIFLEKIQNPLSGTSIVNPQGSFSNPGYDAYRQFQMIGYLTGSSGRYPVMARYRSNNKNKYEYYTIDDSRNRIKITFRTKNDEELYDNDNVNINELGGTLIFKKYENTDGNRYDPNVL